MIPTQQPAIESNFGDDMETEEFQVNVTSTTFHVLLDSLYSNKRQSIMRELATNAYDAHVAAGIPDKPFHVTLPTYLDHTFRIRDYGISLTHDEVMTLYRTLFQSSKDKSNDFVGYMGLGSKSPFAYTDSFTVIAYRDGKARTYLAALNEKRIPTITFVGEEESDEQGFEISFPTHPDDDHLWAAEAGRVFMGFDVPPISNVDYEIPPIVMEGNGWRAYDKAYRTLETGCYIRQGCVIYPVDPPHVNTWDRTQWPLKDKALVIDVPIGSVEVSASRESLSMNEQTTQVIKDAVDGFIADLTKQVETSINEAPTYLEACQRLYKGYFDHLHNEWLANQALEYKGRRLERFISINLSVPFMIQESKKKPFKALKTITFDVLQAHEYQFVIDNGAKVKRKKARLREFLDDTSWGKHSWTRTRFLLEKPRNKDVQRLYRILSSFSDIENPKDHIIAVGALPDVDYSTRSGGNSGGTQRLPYVLKGSNLVQVSKDDMVDDYYWAEIPRKNSGIDFEGRRYDHYELPHIQNAIKRVALEDEDAVIYYMTPSVVKKFDPNPDKQLWNVVKSWVAENEDAIRRWWLGNHNHRTRFLETALKEKTSWANPPAECLPTKIIHHLLSDKISIWQDQGEEEIEMLKIKYPLLFMDSRDDKLIREYIQLMDQQIENEVSATASEVTV